MTIEDSVEDILKLLLSKMQRLEEQARSDKTLIQQQTDNITKLKAEIEELKKKASK